MTATMTIDTGAILREMLTEDTGRAMCDSGGTPKYDADGKYVGSEHGYGRAFERNAGRDFENEGDATLNIGEYDCNVTINLYHWLKEKLSFDEKLNDDFYAFADTPEQEDNGWMSIMDEFMEHLRETRDVEVTGLYGDGDPMLIYTYNHENNLSQDIQFTYFEMNDESYVLLQIHNGCDARGGMTGPKAFKISCYDGASFLTFSDGVIQCSEDHDHYWRTDDGYHYYAEGSCGSGAGTQLEDYDREELELPKEADAAAIVVAAKLQDSAKLYHSTTGLAFCPLCGGMLTGGAM